MVKKDSVMPELPPAISFKRKFRPLETVVKTFLFLFSTLSILVTLGIVVILVDQSLLFFSSGEVNLWDFLTSGRWEPQINLFGILPLLVSTIVTSLIAMLVAFPLGLFVAIYLSEYAGNKIRGVLKPVLELLAGVPTVVYGYFALTFMTPALRLIFGDMLEAYNMLSAGLVMGILITPLIASMGEDALSSVPASLRQAAYGLGATKIETSIQVVLPAAISGIAAAFILGLSRAIGEAMIVALAAGAGSRLTLNPLEGAETLTGYIVRISGGDIAYNTVDYNSIFALALVLFLITLVLNIISRVIVQRFQEVYE